MVDVLDPDREKMRLDRELETALIAAVTPAGDVSLALNIADQMVERELVTFPRGLVLAMKLIELSIQHLAAPELGADPYAKLALHLVDIDVCTKYDLEAVFNLVALVAGLEQGYLEPDQYDRLAASEDDDPKFRGLLSLIKCGAST